MMYRVLCLALLSGCGGMPPSDDLVAAENEYQQSHIDNTAKPGLCETPENLAIMQPNNHYFAERWAEHSGLNGLDIDALLSEFPTTTRECLSCMGTMTKCAVSNCGLGMCDPFFGYGQRHVKCRECTKNACGADMIRCSGLLPNQWPDFDRGPTI